MEPSQKAEVRLHLLRYLNVASVDEALWIVTRYFDEDQLPRKTRLALEELLVG